MPTTPPEPVHGHPTGTNLTMLGIALVVAAGVVLFAPRPPGEDPTLTVPAPVTPVTCTTDDRLCAAVQALEDARDDPALSPEEREVIEALGDEVDAILDPTPPPPPPPPPASSTPPAPTSTTTTTTTTEPPVTSPPPRLGDILDDLLPFTEQRSPIPIPEDPDGDP